MGAQPDLLQVAPGRGVHAEMPVRETEMPFNPDCHSCRGSETDDIRVP